MKATTTGNNNGNSNGDDNDGGGGGIGGVGKIILMDDNSIVCWTIITNFLVTQTQTLYRERETARESEKVVIEMEMLQTSEWTM